MKLRLLALSVMIALSLSACGGDPACTGGESQMCTDQLAVCQGRCNPADAACMEDCGSDDCVCHANYRCPAPGGC